MYNRPSSLCLLLLDAGTRREVKQRWLHRAVELVHLRGLLSEVFTATTVHHQTHASQRAQGMTGGSACAGTHVLCKICLSVCSRPCSATYQSHGFTVCSVRCRRRLAQGTHTTACMVTVMLAECCRVPHLHYGSHLAPLWGFLGANLPQQYAKRVDIGRGANSRACDGEKKPCLGSSYLEGKLPCT